MFKVFFYKDSGLIITCGYECGNSSSCDCAHKCKYNSNHKFHNWSVAVHRFFEYRLHIKLPHLIYFNKEWVKLSGTTKCPHGKSRLYTCWDCKYCDGDPDGVCLNPKKTTTPIEELKVKDPDWGEHHRCSLFNKREWADKYDKNTGKIIWG